MSGTARNSVPARRDPSPASCGSFPSTRTQTWCPRCAPEPTACGTAKSWFSIPKASAASTALPRASKRALPFSRATSMCPLFLSPRTAFSSHGRAAAAFSASRRLHIAIGDPIYPDPAEPPEAAYNRLTAEMRERIVSMWEELRAQRSPQPQTNPQGPGDAPRKTSSHTPLKPASANYQKTMVDNGAPRSPAFG